MMGAAAFQVILMISFNLDLYLFIYLFIILFIPVGHVYFFIKKTHLLLAICLLSNNPTCGPGTLFLTLPVKKSFFVFIFPPPTSF